MRDEHNTLWRSPHWHIKLDEYQYNRVFKTIRDMNEVMSNLTVTKLIFPLSIKIVTTLVSLIARLINSFNQLRYK